MAKKVVVDTCALCRKRGRLKDSHILPKFLWKNSGVIGDGNKYDLLSFTNPQTSKFHQQDGIKEFLCCGSCEGKMSRWEDAAKRVWFNDNSPFRHPVPHPAGYELGQIPYQEMKLFFMSVLLRMDATKNPFFCAVNLGSDRLRLRRMLMAAEPGEPWRYGCLISIMTHRGKLLGDYFSQPVQFDSSNHPGHKFFCAVIAGVMLIFVAGAKTPPPHARGHYLKAGGTWRVPAEEIKSYPLLWPEFQRWAKANNVEL